MSARHIGIDKFSLKSVKIIPAFQDMSLAVATGFFMRLQDKYDVLVTNWHVVTGKNPDTGKCIEKSLAVPDRLKVSCHSSKEIGNFIEEEIQLYDASGEPIWIEHPDGPMVDVVFIPFKNPDVNCVHVNVVLEPKLPVLPGAVVHIVGFPLGLSNGESFPIWKTGHIASDVDLDFEVNRPAFLIDATTRGGMSGSPVYARSFGSFMDGKGGQVIHVGLYTEFIGVYSGRQHENSEIGRVWKVSALGEIAIQAMRHFS